MQRISLAAALLVALSTTAACGLDEEDAQTADALTENTVRPPQVVRIPVRFTRNTVQDVATVFSSSWVPFTGLASEPVNGYEWGYNGAARANAIEAWYAPDQPGAGYATGTFLVEIPFDTTGAVAYGLARVKLERQFVATRIMTSLTRQYSPLRVRAGSDQPCLSVTMGGSLEGKLKAVPVPYTDTGFTERDWKIGAKDASGALIAKVIVGTLQFMPACWPENVEGSTHVSGGVGFPPGAFAMVDKNAGQGSSDGAVIFVNLVENEAGVVSLGATFSTNAGILGERDRAAFDQAAKTFAEKFRSDAQRGEADAAEASAASRPL